MANISNNLTKKNFDKMVSGGKNYLPDKIKKELKTAGFSLTGSRIKKEQAIKALGHLKEKGMLTNKYKRPEEIYKETGVKQFDEDFAVEQEEIQKHVKANIMIDIGNEISAEERGEYPVNYDPRGILGQARLADQISLEQSKRDKAIRKELGKIDTKTNPKGVKGKKSMTINLPDMPIDFGR